MPPPLSLTSLLPAVIDTIFHFAVAEDDEDLFTSAERVVAIPKSFLAIAATSKEWSKLVAELRGDQVLGSVVVGLAFTRSKLVCQRNALLRRRGVVSRLRAEMFNGIPKNLPGSYYSPEELLPRVITEDLLACVPHLRELHLQKLRFGGQDFTAIVVAAAKLCPLMHTLLFPSPSAKSHQSYYALVLTSAQAWLRNMGGSTAITTGLRHLQLSMVGNLPDVHSSNAYIDLVVTSCPNIEILDDALHVDAEEPQQTWSQEDDDADPGSDCAQWQIDLATWTRFCETCTRLTTFSWLGVPFATRFFEVFGDNLKPQLKTLTLGISRDWDWKRYISQVNAETAEALHCGGYGGGTRSIQTVFRACSQLRALRLLSKASNSRRAPTMFDASVFGEDFWVALSRSCPLLESLVVCRHSPERVTLTDSAAHALASLSGLCFVRLNNVGLSGDALFELVVLHSADTRRKRVFEIRPFNQDNEHAYYDILEQFLTRLASYDGVELPCGSRPVRLELASFDSIEDKPWSAQYFARVGGIAQQAHARYPAVLLKGVVADFDEEDEGFGCIETLTFATQPSRDEGDSTDDEGYQQIDNVFIYSTPLSEDDEDAMHGFYYDYEDDRNNFAFSRNDAYAYAYGSDY